MHTALAVDPGLAEPPQGLHKTALYVPSALWRRAKIKAAHENLTLTALVVEALEQYLKSA